MNLTSTQIARHDNAMFAEAADDRPSKTQIEKLNQKAEDFFSDCKELIQELYRLKKEAANIEQRANECGLNACNRMNYLQEALNQARSYLGTAQDIVEDVELETDTDKEV